MNVDGNSRVWFVAVANGALNLQKLLQWCGCAQQIDCGTRKYGEACANERLEGSCYHGNDCYVLHQCLPVLLPPPPQASATYAQVDFKLEMIEELLAEVDRLRSNVPGGDADGDMPASFRGSWLGRGWEW